MRSRGSRQARLNVLEKNVMTMQTVKKTFLNILHYKKLKSFFSYSWKCLAIRV